MPTEIIGLREKIKNAPSEQEVLNLLAAGKKFELASTRTKQSWKLTGHRRIAELRSNDASPNTAPVDEMKKSKSRKAK